MSVPNLELLAPHTSKPRIFVLTDITNEPDDQESLVRYLLYSNEFDTQGLCATTSAWLPTQVAPHVIRRVIKAYGQVVDNLNKHVHPNARYQSEEELEKLVTQGLPVYGMQALAQPPSEGAQRLVQRLSESSKPLWVIMWGGSSVLAEALQIIQKTRTVEEAAPLYKKLRVYGISDQDDTGHWIRVNFPDVFYIVSIHGFGCFDLAAWQGIGHREAPGFEGTKVTKEWLADHIQIGPLGAVYPTMDWGMEGDTPTFLHLIPNGLGDPERPDVGGWGGRYRAINVGSSIYGDVVDTVIGTDGKSYTNQKAPVYRWRDHYQDEFAARMQWTLSPDFASASHPPVPAIDGKTGTDFIRVQGKFGHQFTFDASASYDPDHPDDNSNLEFQWYQYAEPTTRHPAGASFVPRCELKPLSEGGLLERNDAGFENVVRGKKVQVTVPDATKMAHWTPYTGITVLEYHIVLQVVSKTAKYPIRRYKRVVIEDELPPECTGCRLCAGQGKGHD